MADTGPVMSPAVPEVLGHLSTSQRATRLDLAKWLVSPENGLTARVFVNRIWRIFFGMGLSKTTSDSGSQGEAPTHPELLDWLATEFVARGWSRKAMIRLVATSSTYRQSSALTQKLQDVDPYNRLLAHAPRLRVEAEIVVRRIQKANHQAQA